MPKPIAIYYEQPHWFKPLFAELERRNLPYEKLDAVSHRYAIEDRPEQRYSLVVNRMSPSAWNREHGDTIFYTLGYLDHLAARGVRVINGSEAFRSELSKASQLSMLDELGIPYPKARVIHRPSQAADATEGLRFPVVVKPNIGGSGAGVKRFDSREQLAAAAEAGELMFGLDSTALVQEFIPAAGGYIVRCEVLDGKFLYAIKVHTTGETFDLCPADICRTTSGVDLNRAACAIDAPKSGIRVEGYDPPSSVIADVERIMAAAGVELGGVEYMIDERDGAAGVPLFYDVNALSNFVADGVNVVGFDPFARLVDWLSLEATKADAKQWHSEHDAELGIGQAAAALTAGVR
ncbi:RimK family alpha-L-glutamate ligase [Acidipila sp. EB88]|uniref:ATP-grasp domain-containing protein n=1 Tax=Acidipila sp. EB88 TaxID=2305226 RepID=UPI000F5E333B|nr:ATP-grasp domain-containing protein [Acidipila sp. EB88]RRA48400.1 ATP-grasp domain-containing protein [Acidipila sp. EB88]